MIKPVLMFLGMLVSLGLVDSTAMAYSSYSSSGSDGGGWNFDWSLMKDDHGTSYTGQSVTQTEISHYLTKLGYQWSNGIYLGALYESSSLYYNAVGTPSPEMRISYGPSIGYFYSGFFGLATYFTNTTCTLPGGNSYSGGSAYMVTLGYEYAVTSMFHVGLSYNYDSFTWNQFTSGVTTTTVTNSQADTYPSVLIGFNF